MVCCTDNSYSKHWNNLLSYVVLIRSLRKTNPYLRPIWFHHGVTSHLATSKLATNMRLVIILNPSLIYYFPRPNYYSIDQLARYPVFKTFRNSIRTITGSFPLSDCNIHMLFGKTIFRFRKQAMPFGRDNFTWMVLNHV